MVSSFSGDRLMPPGRSDRNKCRVFEKCGRQHANECARHRHGRGALKLVPDLGQSLELPRQAGPFGTRAETYEVSMAIGGAVAASAPRIAFGTSIGPLERSILRTAPRPPRGCLDSGLRLSTLLRRHARACRGYPRLSSPRCSRGCAGQPAGRARGLTAYRA